jgi:hypothetical protein
MQPRTEPITEDERLIDLLQAAWRLDDTEFEKLAKLPSGWLWRWRNHYLAPTTEHMAQIRRLLGFHDAIRLLGLDPRDYGSWWRRTWKAADKLVGARSPLEAIAAEGDVLMDRLEELLRCPR